MRNSWIQPRLGKENITQMNFARNGNITGILTAATSNVTNNFTVGGTADITGTLTAGLIDGGFY